MKNVDLIKYLADSAAGLLKNAENATPEMAEAYLDEAEELMCLGACLVERRPLSTEIIKEAA